MSSANQMTRLEQLHRLKVKLQNQLEQLRRDAEFCSSYPQVWKRYDHVICNTERAARHRSLNGGAPGERLPSRQRLNEGATLVWSAAPQC